MLRLEDEDDDFSLPQPSSRLATLFSQDSQPVTDDSFKYKAPKDPSQKNVANDGLKKTKAPPKTTLLCAYSGHCYKLINGQYSESQKLGVAIIGEVHNNLYSILLYITKEKPISFTRITPTTAVEVGSRNFVSFTDDSCQFWSVGFTKEEEVIGFTKQVALARWMSGNGDKVLKQDLLMGEGCDVGLGDLIEIKVKSFRLVTEGVLILDPVREDIVKFKIGKKTIPQIWEETVMGMKKLGQRLLMYCDEESQLIHNSGDNSLEVKVEEITLIRVKFAKGKEVPKNENSIALPEVRMVMDESESSPYSRHLEESQPISRSANQERAVLMNRIKKLGQPMLPVPKVVGYIDEQPMTEEEEGLSRPSSRSASRPSPDFMEERDGEVVLSQMLIKPDIRPKPNQVSRVIHDTRRSFPIQEYQLQRPAPSFTTFSPFMANPAIPHSQSPDPGISLMMIDMKQQNLDLRSLLMRASDKIDTLSTKVDDIQKSCLHLTQQQQQQQQLQQQLPTSSSSSFLSPLLQCEVNVISQSVDKIFKDNELLRREVREREIKIGNLTQRVNEVSDNNQRLIQKNFDENTSSMVSVKILSEENAALKTSLEEVSNHLAQNKQELSAMKLMLQTRSDEVKEANMLLDEMRVKLALKQDHLGELEAKAIEERSKGEFELERMKKLLAEKESQLAKEREEFNFVEQDKKTMIIEYDRIISDLRETLMRRNSMESDSKVAVKEMEKEYLERLATQEEFHRAMSKNWEEEKAGLVEKLSEADKKHQDKLNEVVAQKNKETQVIKEELKKLSQEYNLIKTMAKDLKEKYDLSFEQHKNLAEENDSKVKGLMNSIYRCFREGFATDKSYGGAHVLSYASKVIRTKTLEMMSNNNANQNNDNCMATSASSSSLTSLSSNTQEDAKSKPDIPAATTTTTYSMASTLVMPSLDVDARNYAYNETFNIRPSDESIDTKPGSRNNCGELSEIGSQNEVKNVTGPDGDLVACNSHVQTNKSEELTVDLVASLLNAKIQVDENLVEESERWREKKEVVEGTSAENEIEESLCYSLAVNFSENSLSDESYLATQSANEDQPVKYKDEIVPSNENERLPQVEIQVDAENSKSNQTKSKSLNDDNEDNSVPKPPPFPDSDVEDDFMF